jgi:hypothetical protein
LPAITRSVASSASSSPQFNEIAEENIRRTRDKLRGKNVEFVTADATQYEIPDDADYICPANPFTGELFDVVVENILASTRRRPRLVTIIYFFPKGLASGGRLSHLAVSGRTPLAEPFRETGAFMPSALTGDYLAAVLATAGATAGAVGVERGSSTPRSSSHRAVRV